MVRIVTAAALLLGICWAPTARAADGDQIYLDSIHQNYFSHLHTDSEWLAEAHKICNLHLSGSDDDQLMDMVQTGLDVPDSVSPLWSELPRVPWAAEGV
jgi:hypothetical protein